MEYIRQPFAISGQRSNIPTEPPLTGEISYATGWGPQYNSTLTVGRLDFNSMMNTATALLRYWQYEAHPEWVNDSANGGVPLGYNVGTVVRYHPLPSGTMEVYICTEDNNVVPPANAANVVNPGWMKIPLANFGNNILLTTGGAATGNIHFSGGVTSPSPPALDSSTRFVPTAWAQSGFRLGTNGIPHPNDYYWYRFGENFGGLQMCCGYCYFGLQPRGKIINITLPLSVQNTQLGVQVTQYSEVKPNELLLTPLVFSGRFINNSTISLQCHNQSIDTGVSGGVFWEAWSI